jgi:4-hydroxy-2-oxoheptanedioate aldolase
MGILSRQCHGIKIKMIKNNFIKQKLESGKCVIGTWSIIPSSIVTDIICSAGLDFIIIDAEHGPITFETAQEMAITCESRGVSPIMRVGDIHEADILKALDIGMHGIQIPNINNIEDVNKVIQYAKYPPIGNRGFSPFTRAGEYSLGSATKLTSEANDNILIGINVEGVNAINNIDEILSVEELDVVFIGLFDLSKALGIPGEVNDSRVIRHLEELSKKISAAGKYPGTIATSVEKMNSFIDIGVKYILYLVDCEILKSGYQNILNTKV